MNKSLHSSDILKSVVTTIDYHDRKNTQSVVSNNSSILTNTLISATIDTTSQFRYIKFSYYTTVVSKTSNNTNMTTVTAVRYHTPPNHVSSNLPISTLTAVNPTIIASTTLHNDNIIEAITGMAVFMVAVLLTVPLSIATIVIVYKRKLKKAITKRGSGVIIAQQQLQGNDAAVIGIEMMDNHNGLTCMMVSSCCNYFVRYNYY